MSSLVSRPLVAVSVLVPSILFFGYLWLRHREKESAESSRGESKEISLAEELKQVQDKLTSLQRSRLDTLEEVDIVEEETNPPSEVLPAGECLFEVADLNPKTESESKTQPPQISEVEVESLPKPLDLQISSEVNIPQDSEILDSENDNMERTKIKVDSLFSCSDIRYREKSVNEKDKNEPLVSPQIKSNNNKNKSPEPVNKPVVDTPKRLDIVIREEDDSGSDCSVEVLRKNPEPEIVEETVIPGVLAALQDPLCSPSPTSPPSSGSLGSEGLGSPLKSEAGDVESLEATFKSSSAEWSDLIEQDEREQMKDFKLDSQVLSSKLHGLELVSSVETGLGRGLDSGVVSPSEDFLVEKETFDGRNNKQRLQSGEDAGIGSDPGDVYSDPGYPLPAPSETLKTELQFEDTQLLAYHFHIPDFLCGKLIGERGRFINRLKEECKCNVILKESDSKKKCPPKRRKDREWGDGSLKVCCLEGTRPNIDRCLDLLRERFSGNEEVTLQQVNKSEKPANPSLNGGSVSLNLAEGIMHEVYVSSIISGGHVFIQQPCHPTFFALERLDSCMSKCYTSFSCPSLQHPIQVNSICVAEVEGAHYRVQVTATSEEEDLVQVKFLDYGGYETLSASQLKQIRTDFLSLPFQAIECYLANVCPNDETSVSALVLEELVRGKVIQARMIGTNEQGVPMVHLYRHHNGQTVMINRELCDRQAASWLDTTIVKLDSPLDHPSNY